MDFFDCELGIILIKARYELLIDTTEIIDIIFILCYDSLQIPNLYQTKKKERLGALL